MSVRGTPRMRRRLGLAALLLAIVLWPGLAPAAQAQPLHGAAVRVAVPASALSGQPGGRLLALGRLAHLGPVGGLSTTIAVQPGWNLISLPLAPFNTVMASGLLQALLDNTGGGYDAIFRLTNN